MTPSIRVRQRMRVVVHRIDAPARRRCGGESAWRMRYSTGSRRLMLGDAMSIFARSTCAPSGNSPARMRRNRSRFSVDAARPVAASRCPARSACRDARGSRRPSASRRRPGRGWIRCSASPVELLVVVRRVVLAVVPGEAEPAHVLLDGVDVLDVLLDRVGVVEAQVAVAAMFGRDAEVEADGLGVADVEVAVGFGRKARDDAAAVDSGRDVGWRRSRG